MLPIDVLVLNLQHLAAPTGGIERTDDAVAHLVASADLYVRIPDATANGLVT